MANNAGIVMNNLPFKFTCSIRDDDCFEGFGLILPREFDDYHDSVMVLRRIRVAGGEDMPIWIQRGYISSRIELATRWSTFVENYDIQPDYALRFSYGGGNHFDVKVYEDEEGEMIEYYKTARCDCFTPHEAGLNPQDLEINDEELCSPMDDVEEMVEQENQSIKEALEEYKRKDAMEGSSGQYEATRNVGAFTPFWFVTLC